MSSSIKYAAFFSLGLAIGFLISTVAPADREDDLIETVTRAEPPPEGSRPLSQASSRTGEPSDEAVPSKTAFQLRYQTLLQLPNGPEKVRQLRELFAEWGATEGETAYAFAKQLSGRERLAYLASAARGWARIDPHAAWNAMMVATNDGAMLPGQVGEVLEELAQQDPILATDLLSQVGSRWNRKNLFGRILDHVTTDGQRTRLLAHLLEGESDGREQNVKALFQNWGRYEFEAPLAAATRIDDQGVSHSAVLGILEGWASVDGRGAFEYVVESGDARLIRDALAPVAKQWTNASTADEIAEVLRSVSGIEGSDVVIKNLVTDLARAEPELAMASVMALDDESAKANHARDALSIWADANLNEAETYFNALPSGRTKETAIWGLFNPAIHQGVSPARIMAHAEALSDPEAIGRALYSMSEYTRTVDLGQKTDQLAAEIESYVSNHPSLKAEMKEKILANLATRKP